MAEVEGQMELPLGRGGWLNGRRFDMPDRGLTAGHVQSRLYRVVDMAEGTKKSRETGGVGIHWSHDIEAVKHFGEAMERPKIIEAAHPGYEHVLDHNNERDRRTLRHTVFVNPEDAFPAEVPIRPGAPLRILAEHSYDPNTGATRRRSKQFEGKA